MRNHAEVVAFIGLGANLGDRARNIADGVAMLSQTPGLTIARISRLLENPAVGGAPNSPPFLNAAAEVHTSLGSHAILHRLMEIENQLGRERRVKWEPRVLDLDLLLFGDQIISSQELVVPHPLMHERRFVLQPLAEIAPDAVHPVLQMTIAGLLEDLTRK